MIVTEANGQLAPPLSSHKQLNPEALADVRKAREGTHRAHPAAPDRPDLLLAAQATHERSAHDGLFALVGALYLGCDEWGGWGSNLRPTDYESGQPVARCMATELGRSQWMRSRSPRFRHVFGMIKVAVGRVVRSPLLAVVDLRAMVNIEDVNHAAALVDPVNDAIGPAPGNVTTDQGPE